MSFHAGNIVNPHRLLRQLDKLLRIGGLAKHVTECGYTPTTLLGNRVADALTERASYRNCVACSEFKGLGCQLCPPRRGKSRQVDNFRFRLL